MEPISHLVQHQRDFFRSGKTRPVEFRRQQLQKLRKVLKENEQVIIDALHRDFRKSPFETYGTEIAIVLEEINLILKKLQSWASPKRVRTSIVHWPARSYFYTEPYGVTLIIGAWNYPLQLTLNPLVGAIAAGNCAVIKPSEIAGETSRVVAEMIRNNFSPEYLTAVEGGAGVSQELLSQKFDFIFFTGSMPVGKIVMQRAAEQLIPVALELGGKSPVIVDADAKLEVAARRIVWGKFINAGQTCVAPDYLLVHEKVKNKFLALLVQAIRQLYGENPAASPDYPRIVNHKNFDRLRNYLTNGRIVTGGQTIPEQNYIAPTILDQISWDDPIMQAEIFGPILPVLEFNSLAAAIQEINARPRPLAFYFFSENRRNQKQIVREIDFGGGCINETVAHVGSSHLPFGGVGHSGIGRYHGKASFETFSYQKSILDKATWLDVPLRYPPYLDKLRWIKLIMN